MINIAGIAALIAAYLIGSVNFGVVLSRLVSNDDVRKYGSKSAGATNMLRTYGIVQAVLTLVLDALKAVGAVLIAKAFGEWYAAAAGVLVMVGHCWPVYYGFKGGKGVATALGVGLTLCPAGAVIGAAIALTVAGITKYMSLGSLIGVVAGAVLMAVLEGAPVAVTSAAMVVIIVYRHWPNIKRLMAGTENKLDFSHKNGAE